ncbi:ion transporter [Aliidiomarina halalkaliphila]|uniref:Ion transporter n=1 Tax=Aliidiomarina halalkaliphila TaxID=2593535 RepID=A0A552X173_9GAMM|nr:ion transporter [Aliidiomarina halalkaliphila]TRW48798.1 ion transporter [Aliidiomarina halalkaliphila]
MERADYRVWQDKFERLRSNKVFETVVIAIILFSALVIGAKTYDEVVPYSGLIDVLDYAITLFFIVELTIRIAAERRFRDFFKNGWNIFDFIIVVGSLIPVDSAESMLLARLLRIFRVLRLVSIVPELRVLMGAFLKALPKMAYVALFMFIIFYIYGAAGSLFFREVNPFYWENVAVAMLTLFRIATFESWTSIMYETMEVYPLSWIYYLSFIFFSAFIFLNMMIGIVLDVMQKESSAFDKEQGVGESADLDAIKDHVAGLHEKMDHLTAHINQLTEQQRKS